MLFYYFSELYSLSELPRFSFAHTMLHTYLLLFNFQRPFCHRFLATTFLVYHNVTALSRGFATFFDFFPFALRYFGAFFQGSYILSQLEENVKLFCQISSFFADRSATLSYYPAFLRKLYIKPRKTLHTTLEVKLC